jgi:hypothetical protein
VATIENKLRELNTSLIGRAFWTHGGYAGVQQDRLIELQQVKSTDAERAQLKRSLLGVTAQRADVARQYAVSTHSL